MIQLIQQKFVFLIDQSPSQSVKGRLVVFVYLFDFSQHEGSKKVLFQHSKKKLI